MSIKMRPEELHLAISIGRKIMEETGPPGPPLSPTWQHVYDRYCKMIDKDIKETRLAIGFEDVEDFLEDLEFEKVHIECFCHWLQEKKYKLVKD